jgi:hypothetical protein
VLLCNAIIEAIVSVKFRKLLLKKIEFTGVHKDNGTWVKGCLFQISACFEDVSFSLDHLSGTFA